jgi:gliding motility-associated-like protein
MHFSKSFSAIIACSIALTAGAQSFMEQPEFIKANSIWNFGEGTGLDFNSGSPLGIPTPGYAPFFGTATLASPQTGALLFYTDGINCYNKNHVAMPNGSGLVPGAFPEVGDHGVCIVPFADDPNKYYIFHTKKEYRESGSGMPGAGYSSCDLYYSVVDLNLDGGNGDVVAGSKGILIDSMLAPSIIAVPGDNCDIWLVTHSTSDPNLFYEPYFKSFHITAAGLVLPPVVSTITGSRIATAFPPPPVMFGAPVPHAYGQCHMTISPDRKMLALAAGSGDFGSLYPDGPLGPVTNFNSPPMDMSSNNPGTTIAQHSAGLLAYKFNPANGIVSSEIFVRNLGSVNNVAFSPDNSKLYANLIGPVNQMAPVSYISGSAVSQYDMSVWDSAAIVSSKYDVYKTDSLYSLEAIYLRTFNNKIYFSRYDDPYHLGVINSPNLSGAACGYTDSVLSYYNNAMNFGNFPNQVVFTQKQVIASQKDTVICGTVSNLTLHANPEGNSFVWDNGSTGSSRTVNAAGSYWVRYFKEDKCVYYVDTIRVKSSGGTTARIDYDSLACAGSATLTSHAAADSYLWSTGATQRSVTVFQSGKYWLQINNDGCTASDTVTVRICNCFLNIPTAFSPNGDGLNDQFKPVLSADCHSLKPYMLSIYNRYGERIFTSADPSRGWDGLYSNGTHADAGTYFFSVSYHISGSTEELFKKGDVTLIR